MDANPKLRHFVVERPPTGPMLPDVWQQIVDGYLPRKHPLDTGRNASHWTVWYEFEDHSMVAYLFGPGDELRTFERLAASAWTALPECVANRPLAPTLEDVASRLWRAPPACVAHQPSIAFALEQKTWPTLYLDPPDKKAPPFARSERWMWFVYWLLRGQSGSYLRDMQDGQHKITELMVDPFTASRIAIDLLLADTTLDWDAESPLRSDQRHAHDGPDSQNFGSCNVALLTAIPIETVAVVEELRRLGIASRKVQKRGRYFDVFEMPSDRTIRVVFTQATDKGGQPASAVTYDTLEGFHPELVLLVGVAGGFAERGVKLYDIIVARNIFNYDPERVQAQGGGERPQPYRTDAQLARLVSYLNTRGQLADVLGGAEIHHKDFASGEKVVAWRDAPLRQELLALSCDIYGVETEGHGVMHAICEAFNADHSVEGAMIKCVSDLSDEDMTVAKETKQRQAAMKAARVALRVIANFRRR
jgi:nucleoside phosphorylase